MAALIHCCLQWKYSDEEIEQIQRSLKIDKAIEREKQSNRRQVKLLLLGAGESGKSTFLKQMRIIHGVKFETEAIHEFQSIVYQNIIRGMRVLVDAREKLCIPWESENNANLAPFLLRVDNVMQFDTKVFMEYAVYIQQLWQDHGIQEAYERRREFQLVSLARFILLFYVITILVSIQIKLWSIKQNNLLSPVFETDITNFMYLRYLLS